ncbi:hypothetical protein, partial [Lactobacillus delbrueckii]|uniref:hypothetical protein n=1 Tax=Lactobacillus delbrueckii TaxID=1584 RepID=UPI0021A780B3
TPNLTAFTGVDSQNLPDVMVSVQFILAIGEKIFLPFFNSFSSSVILTEYIIRLPSAARVFSH